MTEGRNVKKFSAVIAVAALAATPGTLSAQACAGSHATHGQASLGAGVSFTDGAVGYGLAGGGFMNSPLFMSGGYTRVNYDDTDAGGNELSATLGAELPGPRFSLCPAASFGYSWFDGLSEGTGLDGMVFGAGLGAGRTFGDRTLFTPHGSVSLVHVRSSASVGDFSATESDTGAAFAAGFKLGTDRFHAGPSVSVTTFDGSDPVFNVGAGMVF